jgi:arylsulfatase A-like enzyme
MGVYDAGWEALREQRRARAQELGIIPPGIAMVDASTTNDWGAYTIDEQRYHAKRMAVYAGMIDAMDHNIGRLVTFLKDTDQYENTVFIFTSDNGSEASGVDYPRALPVRISLALQDYTTDYDTLGLKGSFNTIGPSFASAAASPLADYKFYAGEGGMRVPLIIAGQSIPQRPQLLNALTYVTDISATILDIADVEPPNNRYGGRPVEPMTGRSLLPLIHGEVDRVYSQTDVIGYELAGNAALFQGDYKIILNAAPVGDNKWHLYNIATDPGETNDLSKRMPKRLQEMLDHYQQYVRENGVLPLPANYNPALQGVFNGLLERLRSQILLALIAVLILVPFFIAYRTRKR